MNKIPIVTCLLCTLTFIGTSRPGELPESAISGRAVAFVPGRWDPSFMNSPAVPELGSGYLKNIWDGMRNYLPLEKPTVLRPATLAEDPDINLKSILEAMTRGKPIDLLYWHGHTFNQGNFLSVAAFAWTDNGYNAYLNALQEYSSGFEVNGHVFSFDLNKDLLTAWLHNVGQIFDDVRQ